MVQPKSLSIHINILINIYISIYIYIRFCGGSCLVNRWLLFEKPVVITWLTIGYRLVIHIRYIIISIYIRRILGTRLAHKKERRNDAPT